MKQRKLVLGASLTLALLHLVSSEAHHSFAQQYDVNQPITVKGVVTEVSWQNPHSHIYIDAQDEAGKTVRWAAEGFPTAPLRRQGFSRDAIKQGDRVSIIGWRSRTETQRIAGRYVILPDGTKATFGPAQ